MRKTNQKSTTLNNTIQKLLIPLVELWKWIIVNSFVLSQKMSVFVQVKLVQKRERKNQIIMITVLLENNQ